MLGIIHTLTGCFYIHVGGWSWSHGQNISHINHWMGFCISIIYFHMIYVRHILCSYFRRLLCWYRSCDHDFADYYHVIHKFSRTLLNGIFTISIVNSFFIDMYMYICVRACVCVNSYRVHTVITNANIWSWYIRGRPCEFSRNDVWHWNMWIVR